MHSIGRIDHPPTRCDINNYTPRTYKSNSGVFDADGERSVNYVGVDTYIHTIIHTYV